MTGTGQRCEWFELRSGGETPQYMLLVPRDNWAALDPAGESFQERLAKVLGERKAGKVFEKFTDALKTNYRSTVRIRTDLSLIPNSTGKTP